MRNHIEIRSMWGFENIENRSHGNSGRRLHISGIGSKGYRPKEKDTGGQRLNDHEQSVEYVKTLYSDPCCYCGRPMQHIDHIVPVAKDGAEYWTNLTAACQRCNNRKRDKSLLDFLLYRLDYPENRNDALWFIAFPGHHVGACKGISLSLMPTLPVVTSRVIFGLYE